jgi:hopanoid C-2 methylase
MYKLSVRSGPEGAAGVSSDVTETGGTFPRPQDATFVRQDGSMPQSDFSGPDLAVIPQQSCAPAPQNYRRILCVFPRYAHSFGTFDHAFPLLGVRAFMPPQGLLLIAAYLPEEWDVRFIDENIGPAGEDDFRWADAVFISGMHVQRPQILDLNRRAHRAGRVTVLGGPSVSGCPDWYSEIDILHLGELGDATEELIARLDRSVRRPTRQEVYQTTDRVPLAQFPVPAYDRIDLTDYFLASVQFSSGCPFRCEFCDIPALYGRNPRLKTPEQVTAELDAMLARGNPGCVYFVDDNFIGNPKAAVLLLEELVRWQNERGFPIRFACEATLNLAHSPKILELMREAAFSTVFCGIETPEEHALEAMHKKQNLRQPLLEAIETLNSYGLEVVSGIIVGLDTDTPTTGDRILQFVEESSIPLLTINMLHALPKTPLWDRLEAAGRLIDEPGRESNVDFLLPYATVVAMWRDCITRAYEPAEVYARYQHQIEHTFPNRRKLPVTSARVNLKSITRGLKILGRVIWWAGLRSDYRRLFWKMALPALLRGRIEEAIHVGVVAHHLIEFARECARGEAEQCFYASGYPEGEEPPMSTVEPADTRIEPQPVRSRSA